LDKLTQEEARMAFAELLKVTHSADDRVRGVDGKVENVRDDVHDVGNKVQGVDDRAQGIDSDVKDISREVRCRRQIRSGQPFVISSIPSPHS
jgi:hypothetical protein